MKNYYYEDLDKRIIKTRSQLVEALIELLQSDKKIKVLGICDKAKKSAMTYYHHFGNKNDLMNFTAMNQLNNTLPIPNKLKPISMKHLIYYLINKTSEFFISNRTMLLSCYERALKHGFKNSYLDALYQCYKCEITNEIKRLFPTIDGMNINIWSNFIIGEIVVVFFDRLIHQKDINANTIWNSIKCLFNMLKF